jgi:4-hydroxy-3-polyprenylbenzoate decarboxylase
MKRYIVGISGASGAIYGVRLVEALLANAQREVHLIVSPAGARVLAQELGVKPRLAPFDPASFLNVNKKQASRLHYHPHGDIGAGPASGTFRFEAMIVCPCSMRTLGAMANGLADNLMTRAADVALKEGRPLVVVPRETPLSAIHLRNMLRLAEAGAAVLPANPAFYHHPRSIEDLVRYVTQKIFDRLGLAFPDAVRWGEKGGGEPK